MDFIQIMLITTLLTNVIVLILLYVLYQNDRKFIDVRPFFKQIDKLRSQVAMKEGSLLKEALDKSTASVKETLKTLKGVEDLSEETKLSLEKAAEKLVQDSVSKHSEVYQKIMNDITNSYQNEFAQLNNLQIQESTKALNILKNSTEVELKNMREGILRVAQDERNKVEAEMSSYKEKLKSDLDGRIYSIISEVAKETIGTGVDISKHEELVMKSLQKAKNEKLL